MGEFFKELETLANDERTINIWIFVGATILFIFVIYIISKTINSGPSSYIGRGNQSHNNRGNNYDKPTKDQELLKGKRVYADQYFNSNQYKKEENDNFNEQKEVISQSDKEKIAVDDYCGNPINHTTNEDGTVRTEINFDSVNDINETAPSLPKYEYLETANNGQFRKLLPSDEKSFFRTWEENGIRKFEFHGNVEKALANINAIFDDVCEIEGKQNGATQIINIGPGVLDSKLKVETLAKIKLS